MTYKLIDASNLITPSDQRDLMYARYTDHGVVYIDRTNREWPVFMRGAGSIIDQGLPLTFDDSTIPPEFTQFQDFWDNWKEVKDPKPDANGRGVAVKVFDSFTSFAKSECPTIVERPTTNGIATGYICRVPSTTGRRLPCDPRDDFDGIKPVEYSLRVQPFSPDVTPKRSAIKPHSVVYHDNVPFLDRVVTPPIQHVVRKIFRSSRRGQWTFSASTNGNYALLESPGKIIRFLSAIGFNPLNITPCGQTLLPIEHEGIAFFAEYEGAVVCIHTVTERKRLMWSITGLQGEFAPRYRTDDDRLVFRYRPYVSPGFALRPNMTCRPVSFGAFTHVGARNVPDVMEYLSRFACHVNQCVPQHDTKPMRYYMQMQYRYHKLRELLDASVGDLYIIDKNFILTCASVPGSVLKFTCTQSRSGLRLSFRTEAIARGLMTQWCERHPEIIHHGLQLRQYDYRSGKKDGGESQIVCEFYVNDLTPVEVQANLVSEFALGWEELVKSITERDEYLGATQ